jgi:uncharacterized protein (TIGR03118 family)
MKKKTMKETSMARNTVVAVIIFGVTAMQLASCKKNNGSTDPDPNGNQSGYQQINLVADVAGAGAEMVDKDLLNPWGLAFGPTGIIWISGNHSGVTTVYNNEGGTVLPAVAIPFADQHKGGAPTGVVFNNTNDFIAPGAGTKKSVFIYATENGTVSVWNGADSTVTVANRSAANAIYKGIAICKDGLDNFLYLADFRNGKIDVLDKNFNYVDKPFVDPDLPAAFAPFNIKAIGGKLYVTYARQDADREDDVRGDGNGYVDIFNPDGSFVKRFASQGTLNSPWGIVQIPSTMGNPQDVFGVAEGSILIGIFGNGRINIFDVTGTYKGQLMRSGAPLTIDGLWEIAFEDASIQGSRPGRLYFTAGPQGESHGLFGYVSYQN